MFPTLSHLIEYLAGVYIPLPVQTFGLFVALAFLSAYLIFKKEFQRKEKTGQIEALTQKIEMGHPPQLGETILNGCIGFVIGYKLIHALFNYQALVDNPQEFLLSLQGSWPGGIIIGILFSYTSYSEKKKAQLSQINVVENVVHPHELMGQILIWAAIWGMLGAKLFHNLEYWDEFIKDPIDSLLSFSGLTFYGGVLFGGAAVIYYTSKNKIKPLYMLDIGAPGIMLGYAVGRLGCHLSGDGDWGIEHLNPKPSYLAWLPDWAWAFKFPHNVINEGIPIPGCTGKFCRELPQPVYPTSLYEFLMCLVLFLILWYLRKRIRFAGMLFAIYLILNGVERFLIELIRVNAKYHVAGLAFTQAELISTLMIITGLFGIYYTKRNGNRHPQTIAPKYA